MKMVPISFILDLEDGQGFTQFRDDKGNWVYRRDVEVHPFLWKCGAGVTFKIIEFYSDSVDHNLRKRELHREDFWDKDYMEIASLLDNLASGDLRGRTAEMTAHSVYWKLFTPSDAVKKYLPELAKFYKSLLKN
jgi:hypothetical protein